MKLFKFPKIETIAKLIHNSLHRKNIILFIGTKGMFLGAFDNNICIEAKFISSEDQNNLNNYQYFFNKYKDYYVYVFLATHECKIKHELVPTLLTILKVYPIEKFIKDHFSSNDIVAYDVYNISPKTGEVWSTIISSISYEGFTSEITNFILSKSYKFGGIYFLNLELKVIIELIIKKVVNQEINNDLQIFGTVLSVTGITFAVKHQGDVMTINTIEYPNDKSDAYIQGIFEQQINDYLISYKSYLSRFNLKVSIILVVNENLKSLLKNSSFGECSLYVFTSKDIQISETSYNDKFSDTGITELFTVKKTYLALNKDLKSIIQFNLINLLLFKPLMIILIILIGILASLKFRTWQNQRYTSNLNEKYYEVAQGYRMIKEKYPKLENLTNLADLHSLETLLAIEVSTPFDMMNELYNNLTPEIELLKIWWHLKDPNNIVPTNQLINFGGSLRFNLESLNEEEGDKFINQFMNHKKTIFKNYIILSNRIFEGIIKLHNKIIIPVEFFINGPN